MEGGTNKKILVKKRNAITTINTSKTGNNENTRNNEKTGNKKKNVNKNVIVASIFFFVMGILTRMYHIGNGDKTTWDEAHFGKFGSYYLKRQFYFDVHPPLGKIIVGLCGYLVGYDGTFDFGSGLKYPESMPYVGMRILVGMFGALVVPLGYLTALELEMTEMAAFLVGWLILFDNGLVVITRIILLDPILLFFIALSMYSFSMFKNRKTKEFGLRWHVSLLGTGIGIGSAMSVKWVGLFTVGLIGIETIVQLLNETEGMKRGWKKPTIHFIGRVIYLIVVPLQIYALSFVLHFAILSRSGPGDGQMGSLFQAGLVGNTLNNLPINVAYGSVVTIRSGTTAGGLLHSHVQRYPFGSKEQQVTTYSHKDLNNNWTILSPLEERTGEQLRILKDGDLVRLMHVQTKRLLRINSSVRIPAPLSTDKIEVSCNNTQQESNTDDEWIIKSVIPKKDVGKEIKTIQTQFNLVHKKTGQCLQMGKQKLPEWGFSQGEIVGVFENKPCSRSILWNFEENSHPQLENKQSSGYRSSFFSDFKDLNAAMNRTNNALSRDEELEPCILTTEPYHWPFLLKGIRMTQWNPHDTKFYMIGNPFVWWLSTTSIITALVVYAWCLVLRKRNSPRYKSTSLWMNWIENSFFCLLGWSIHYLPFFIMGRVLYLHHYFPCLLFAILTTGQVFDLFSFGRSPLFKSILFVGICSSILAVFCYFSQACYGINGPSSYFSSGRKWLTGWNL